MRAVEVESASKDVRAGQSLERQLRTVGSATDGTHAARNVASLHGFKHNVNHVRHGLNHFAHIIVLVGHFDSYRAFAVAGIGPLHRLLQESLAAFKAFAVVVANDVAELCLFHIAFDVEQVEKPS